MSFNFGGLATSSQPAANSGSLFGGTNLFGQPSTTPAASTGLFGNTGSTAAAAPSLFGTSTNLFGNAPATTSSFFSSSTASTTSAPSGLGFGSTTAPVQFQFPTKSADAGSSSSQYGSGINAPVVKAGSAGMRPKDNLLAEDFHKIVFEMEDTIKKYQNIQREAEDITLKDAVEWQSEMKRFGDAVDVVQRKLKGTFNLIDLLRKNSARLRGHNMLSSRLALNPGAYYSVSSSVETYFTEILTGLRTEMEILEEELRHLEDLHEDLLKPGERYNPLDLQGTYMYLSKIVNGVAVACDEISKIGEELRKEMQSGKNQPLPTSGSNPPFLAQDVAQTSAARSLFSAVPATPLAQNLAKQSKSPLLQPLSADMQFSMFNPAMRSLMRMDSNSPKMMPNSSSGSPGPSRFQSSFSIGSGSPGF